MEFLLLMLIPSLVIIQTIVGVGVLVVGTPILLLLNYNIIEIMSLLLPISILTSFLNITLFSMYKISTVDHKKYKYFFIICIPGIFTGLKLLEAYKEMINFELFVSLIILLSLFFKLKTKKKIINLSNIKKKIIILITGIVHGLTNSGGTILALFISSSLKNRNKVNFEISLFYFLLACVQFFIFIFLFYSEYKTDLFFEMIVITLISVYVGNILNKMFSDEYFHLFLNLIVFFSAISLILKNFIN